jgi:FkbM family methyltransferase
MHLVPLAFRRAAKVALGRERYWRKDLRCRHLRLGDGYSAWNIHAETTLGADAVVYSVGIGWDIGFDRALIGRFGCTIHAFDPTPSSIDWLRTQSLPLSFIVHEIGLAEYDGNATIEWSHTPRSFVADAPERNGHPRVPVRRLRSICDALGHDHIDLLKIDIEGAEYAVLDDIIESGPLPKQLLVEFHHRLQSAGLACTVRAVDRLRAAGYALFAVSGTGEEFSFLRRDAI